MPLPRAAALLAALLAACISTGRSLEVSFAADHRSYELTHGAAKTTLFSAKGGIAAFVDGRWHTQAEGTLKPVGAAKAVKGEHPALGAFTGTELQFVAGATPMTATARTPSSSSSSRRNIARSLRFGFCFHFGSSLGERLAMKT